ncbi:MULTISPECIES: hypothetical protein [unclassified Leptospira]|uniref:hypothetical protein n=1 Tax=unclassified Leptospira TaxID=2633828 RepID=UPI0002BF9104|nr:MULTISPECIES: hypothetical protein [unclassified Leptospira]EMK00857.1 hypothetical protein LEP1GSC192_1819 [Leptospira sp. B5-022]MCR1795511.1 hypothetical protein [Leptospira sp. id769339]
MYLGPLEGFQDQLFRPVLGWSRDNVGLLTGRQGIYKLALRWEYAFAVSGFQVFNLDCAIRFDVFTITEETRKRRVSPEALLEKILVQRAFTPYQILDSLREIYTSTKENTIYFLLAPCKQFFDGDVQDDEGLFLLEKLVLLLERMRSKRIPIVLVESTKYTHPNFQKIFPKLVALSDDLWELNMVEGHSYLKIRKAKSIYEIGTDQSSKQEFIYG